MYVEGFRITEELLDGSGYPRQTLPIATDEEEEELSTSRIEALAEQTREALGTAVDQPITNVTRALERGGVAVAPLIMP